jgi:ABC-2 type transport system ATP-binding protein
VIRVENLTKFYGPRLAIADVTFTVHKGEIVGFLGPNGAGKTTTMRILTGYLPPSSGRAEIAGYDIFTQSLEARRHIGYLPESVPLYPEMTVRAYLHFMATLKGVPGPKQRARVSYVMERTRITEVADTLIAKLSRGYRQRVGLAQALVHDPPVLVLDEPTVGLDPRQIIETRQLIKSLGGDHTIILSTHILPEVSMTCSRVLIINKGRLIAEDTPENLTRRLRGSDRIELEVRGPGEEVRRRLASLPHVLGVQLVENRDGRVRCLVDCAVNTDIREQLAATVVRSGWGLLQLRNVGMSLEEVFLQLTTTEEVEG